jgi:hypothetical protein
MGKNSMGNSRNLVLVIVLSLCAGCATQPNTENAIRLIAYGPGDRSSETNMAMLTDSDVMERGIIYEFEAGDTIRMSVELGGNLAEATQAQPIDILLKRKVWLFANNDGWWASLDGNDFQKFEKFSNGGSKNSSLSIGLGLSKEDKTNDLKIRLVLNPS